jgi:hypothetical protein
MIVKRAKHYIIKLAIILARFHIPLLQLGIRMGVWSHMHAIYMKCGSPTTVLEGVFKGMIFPPSPCGGTWMPKLLGTYEMELQPALQSLFGRQFDLLIDIGCSDGYYAVGLLRMMQFQRVVLYDSDAFALAQLKRNLSINKLTAPVSFKGTCSVPELKTDLDACGNALVICDCEGAEMSLLDPSVCPELLRATILVEVHDFPAGGPIGLEIRRRFTLSHRIESYLSKDRAVSDCRVPVPLTADEIRNALDEGRGAQMEWLLMTPY